MNKCVECLKLDPYFKDFTKHKCWCNSKSNYVKPRDEACTEFIKSIRTYYENQEILNDTDEETLLDILLNFISPNNKEEKKEEVITSNTLYVTNIPFFLDMLLRYAGYRQESNTYKLLENIFSIIRRYESDYFLKTLDDEYSSIIHLRLSVSFFDEDYQTVSKKMIDKTSNMINAYNNKNYSLVYKEWLIYLKYLYNVFKMDKYVLEENKSILLRKFK